MIDLSVQYMGLKLKSPLILGSCGLSSNISKLKAAEQAGFGAVVLKSIFEEEIAREVASTLNSEPYFNHSQSYDYLSRYQEMASFERFLENIRAAKAAVSIPIIASVNCSSESGWTQYAKAIEETGVDGLEVNCFVLPIDFEKGANSYQDFYISLIQKLQEKLSIPIALKTSYYFTDLAHFMTTLSYTGISALVLFNRFLSPDINIDTFEMTSSHYFSSHEEFANTLRWTGLLSGKIQCDLSATTGVTNAVDMIKLLLAGAKTVQAASIFYHNGLDYAATMLSDMKTWMEKHEFASIDQFRGKMKYASETHTNAYFRMQFMKHVGGID